MTHNNVNATSGYSYTLICQRLSCPFITAITLDGMTKSRKTKEHFEPEKCFSNLENEQFAAYLLFYRHPLLNPFDFLLNEGTARAAKWKKTKRQEKRSERKEEREIEIAFPFLNIHISHSVHALRNMLSKLITGFSWCAEYHVGEEPKSEANC